jgi:predicted transcriptional regulator
MHPALMSPDERRDAVRALMADGMVRTRSEVASALGFTYGTVSQALRELRMLGKADHVPAPEGSHYPIAGWRRCA